MRRLAAALISLAGCKGAAATAPFDPVARAAAIVPGDAAAEASAAIAAEKPDPEPPPVATAETRDAVGPFELPMMPGRNVWYARPRTVGERRLIAHLHGQCAHPSYSCGQWLDAGIERGFVVCPTGNERCGSPIGPPQWDESFALMDQDLERGIAAASRAEGDGGISRAGSVMTGFSRGGWAAIDVVRRHPGRWPFLIVIEADVTMNAALLRAAKVERVALIAADHGTELAGERSTVDALKAAGFPAELFVMPGSWHLYSTNIDAIMRQALAFVLAGGPREP